MRPLCVLIVPLQKLPEIAIREGLSTSLRTGGREFSPTANNNHPAIDLLAYYHRQTSFVVVPLFANLECFIMSFRGNNNLMQLAGMRHSRLVINRVGIRSGNMLS